MKISNRKSLAILLPLCALFLPATSIGSIKKISDTLELHYNALPSIDIPVQVVKSYGLKRSKHIGLLNISLVQISDDPMGGPPIRTGVKVSAECTATNLNRQQRKLNIKTVRSDLAVYHLATYPIENEDEIHFVCQITIPSDVTDDALDQQGRVIDIDFRQDFYIK